MNNRPAFIEAGFLFQFISIFFGLIKAYLSFCKTYTSITKWRIKKTSRGRQIKCAIKFLIS